MNKNVVIILIGAICTAFIVALMVQSLLAPDRSEGGADVDLVQILVASEKLTEGEIIEASKVRWQEWPRSAMIKGVYQKRDDQVVDDMALIGKPVRRTVEMGEPILSSIVLVESQGNFLAANLQPGMLAYSIPVSASSSVGGFARPGDFVDVLLTYDVRLDSKQQEEATPIIRKYASETILKGVRVMAVDQTSAEDNRDAKIGKVVTLEVSPEGAEVLALALEMGQITLALRHLGALNTVEDPSPSPDYVPTTDVTISKTLQTLNNISDGRSVGADVASRNPNSRAVIRIYRGGASETISVPYAR